MGGWYLFLSDDVTGAMLMCSLEMDLGISDIPGPGQASGSQVGDFGEHIL